MNAIVRCKCKGKLGATRVDLDCVSEFFWKTFSFSPWMRCWGCGASFKWAEIRGRFSAAHQCDARCESSVGTKCECSCRGRNHGLAFAG